MSEKAKQANENKYLQLINQMPAGYALHEIICNDKGEPVDYRFLEVNPAFEKLTGLKAKDIAGKTCLEVLPQTEHSWIERYGKVALTGESISFENFAQEIDRHFEVTAFCTAPNHFACTFNDITEHKQAKEKEEKLSHDLRERVKELDCLYGISEINEKLGVTLDSILKETVKHVCTTMQYPEFACARIIIQNLEF